MFDVVRKSVELAAGAGGGRGAVSVGGTTARVLLEEENARFALEVVGRVAAVDGGAGKDDEEGDEHYSGKGEDVLDGLAQFVALPHGDGEGEERAEEAADAGAGAPACQAVVAVVAELAETGDVGGGRGGGSEHGHEDAGKGRNVGRSGGRDDAGEEPAAGEDEGT